MESNNGRSSRSSKSSLVFSLVNKKNPPLDFFNIDKLNALLKQIYEDKGLIQFKVADFICSSDDYLKEMVPTLPSGELVIRLNQDLLNQIIIHQWNEGVGKVDIRFPAVKINESVEELTIEEKEVSDEVVDYFWVILHSLKRGCSYIGTIAPEKYLIATYEQKLLQHGWFLSKNYTDADVARKIERRSPKDITFLCQKIINGEMAFCYVCANFAHLPRKLNSHRWIRGAATKKIVNSLLGNGWTLRENVTDSDVQHILQNDPCSLTHVKFPVIKDDIRSYLSINASRVVETTGSAHRRLSSAGLADFNIETINQRVSNYSNNTLRIHTGYSQDAIDYIVYKFEGASVDIIFPFALYDCDDIIDGKVISISLRDIFSMDIPPFYRLSPVRPFDERYPQAFNEKFKKAFEGENMEKVFEAVFNWLLLLYAGSQDKLTKQFKDDTERHVNLVAILQYEELDPILDSLMKGEELSELSLQILYESSKNSSDFTFIVKQSGDVVSSKKPSWGQTLGEMNNAFNIEPMRDHQCFFPCGTLEVPETFEGKNYLPIPREVIEGLETILANHEAFDEEETNELDFKSLVGFTYDSSTETLHLTLKVRSFADDCIFNNIQYTNAIRYFELDGQMNWSNDNIRLGHETNRDCYNSIKSLGGYVPGKYNAGSFFATEIVLSSEIKDALARSTIYQEEATLELIRKVPRNPAALIIVSASIMTGTMTSRFGNNNNEIRQYNTNFQQYLLCHQVDQADFFNKSKNRVAGLRYHVLQSNVLSNIEATLDNDNKEANITTLGYFSGASGVAAFQHNFVKCNVIPSCEEQTPKRFDTVNKFVGKIKAVFTSTRTTNNKLFPEIVDKIRKLLPKLLKLIDLYKLQCPRKLNKMYDRGEIVRIFYGENPMEQFMYDEQ